MRALITGGAGFIGSHLSERLHVDGHEVMVVDDLSSSSKRVGFLDAMGLRRESIDIREQEFVNVALSFRQESIFHLAAQIDVRRSVADPVVDADINIIGTLKVLEAARLSGSKIVFASSGGTIYGEPHPSELPLTEESRGRPTSPYGISKKVAEDYFRFYSELHGVPFVSLALGNVYGPRQDPHGEAGVVAIFALKLISDEACTIFGDGTQTRDFIYVGDVVDAFVRAASTAEGGTFNIATGTETSITDLYFEMASLCGVSKDPEYAPERPGELARSCLDVHKAAETLLWAPRTPLRDGLAKTIAALRRDPTGAT